MRGKRNSGNMPVFRFLCRSPNISIIRRLDKIYIRVEDAFFAGVEEWKSAGIQTGNFHFQDKIRRLY